MRKTRPISRAISVRRRRNLLVLPPDWTTILGEVLQDSDLAMCFDGHYIHQGKVTIYGHCTKPSCDTTYHVTSLLVEGCLKELIVCSEKSCKHNKICRPLTGSLRKATGMAICGTSLQDASRRYRSEQHRRIKEGQI